MVLSLETGFLMSNVLYVRVLNIQSGTLSPKVNTLSCDSVKVVWGGASYAP